jgi:LytTr DNA-binding domain
MKNAAPNYATSLKASLRDPLVYLLGVLTLVVAAVNVSTKLADAESFGTPMPWQNPVTTEYSSAAAIILLLPFLMAFFKVLPISLQNWHRRLLPYFGASLLFSLLHVALMVLVRNLAWPPLFDVPYDFFAGGYDALIYEYRKDAMSFLVYTLAAALQQQIRQAKAAKVPEHEPVTLKSGATTILLQSAEFLYAKSASNYADITCTTGTHLARITLAELETLLRAKDCDIVRIHRSTLINRAAILETSPIAGGDLSVKLRGGETLRASRRYKDQLNK